MMASATNKKPERTSHAELARKLRAEIPAILHRWEPAVRRDVPAARGKRRPILLDHIPHFLDRLADALATSDQDDAATQVALASFQHAEQRAGVPGYTLDQVIYEYALLRNIIIETLHPGVSCAREINAAIDYGIQAAATQYVHSTQRALRASEARLRNLQVVTDAALATLKIDDLLSELLDRIQEILSVDTVSILLLQGDRLVRRAAVGIEQAAGGEVSIPVGTGFAGRIAAERKPLIITDAEEGDVYSPLLRERGICSLLGAPLLVGDTLIGVVHIGSVKAREFKPEEVALLQLVADRAALAIDHARLYSELQMANQRKDEFLAILGHELRTPLSAISNALFVLENNPVVHETGGRQLLSANRQVRHLTRLLEDLMDISRISRGKIELRKERLAVCRIAGGAAESVRPLVESRGLELQVVLTPEDLFVDADPTRLEQVVTNLLNNAAKFTQQGGRITLSVEREGESAVVRVSDTGAGIDPSLLPRIFDMYHQGERTSAATHGGLGIGLALVRRLVEMHGGSVSAESEGAGQGATFTVRLPLVAVIEPPAAGSTRRRPRSRAEKPQDAAHPAAVAASG